MEPIKVEGLKEFNRSLRALSSELPKGLRLAHNRAAAIVVGEAVPRVPIGPSAGGHVKNTIKAASTRTETRVRAGSKKNPYYPWLDFGGSVGRNKSVKRPFLKRGRYLWASYDDRSKDVETELVAALSDLIKEAGLT